MKKILKYFPIIFIFLFLGLYFSYQNGYYERMTSDKIKLTNEQIEKFEEDVINGKDVMLKDYINNDKNYSTKTSKLSLNISNKLESVLDKGIKFLFRKLSSMVE